MKIEIDKIKVHPLLKKLNLDHSRIHELRELIRDPHGNNKLTVDSKLQCTWDIHLLEALKEENKNEVEVEVKDEADALFDLVENLTKLRNYDPLLEGQIYTKIRALGYSEARIAERRNLSQQQISERIKLTRNLVQDIRPLVTTRVVSVSQAEIISNFNKRLQRKIAKDIVQRKNHTVRKLEIVSGINKGIEDFASTLEVEKKEKFMEEANSVLTEHLNHLGFVRSRIEDLKEIYQSRRNNRTPADKFLEKFRSQKLFGLAINNIFEFKRTVPDEYLPFINSVWRYPDSNWQSEPYKSLYLPISSFLHPNQFIPFVPEFLIAEFTNIGETVADIMAGVGNAGIAAVNMRRKFIGFDINPKFVKIAKERFNNYISKFKVKQEFIPKMEIGDARKINLENETIDYVVFSPPYDASSIEIMPAVMKESFRILKKNRYCTVIIRNFRRKGVFKSLFDSVKSSAENVGFVFHDEIIHDTSLSIKKAAHRGRLTQSALRSKTKVVTHEYILTFRKPERAVKEGVEYEDLEKRRPDKL